MKSKIFTLLMACCFGLQAMAIDKQALSDTLTAFVHERAFAESVKVSNIRVKNQYVTIYTLQTYLWYLLHFLYPINVNQV